MKPRSTTITERRKNKIENGGRHYLCISNLADMGEGVDPIPTTIRNIVPFLNYSRFMLYVHCLRRIQHSEPDLNLNLNLNFDISAQDIKPSLLLLMDRILENLLLANI